MFPSIPLAKERATHLLNTLDYPFAILLTMADDDIGHSVVYDVTNDLDYAWRWYNPVAGRIVRIYRSSSESNNYT